MFLPADVSDPMLFAVLPVVSGSGCGDCSSCFVAMMVSWKSPPSGLKTLESTERRLRATRNYLKHWYIQEHIQVHEAVFITVVQLKMIKTLNGIAGVP